MENKKVDDQEIQTVAPVRVDKFGFVKQEQKTPEGLIRSRSAFEFERYVLAEYGTLQFLSIAFFFHTYSEGL